MNIETPQTSTPIDDAAAQATSVILQECQHMCASARAVVLGKVMAQVAMASPSAVLMPRAIVRLAHAAADEIVTGGQPC